MDNSVTLIGNATRPAELRFANNGTAMASFGLAVNNRRKGVSGEWEDEPHFFDCQCFGTLAENVAETVEKGTRIIVHGRLSFRQWEKDGDKRSKVEVVADAVGPELRWATATVHKNDRKD